MFDQMWTPPGADPQMHPTHGARSCPNLGPVLAKSPLSLAKYGPDSTPGAAGSSTPCCSSPPASQNTARHALALREVVLREWVEPGSIWRRLGVCTRIRGPPGGYLSIWGRFGVDLVSIGGGCAGDAGSIGWTGSRSGADLGLTRGRTGADPGSISVALLVVDP